MRSTRSGQASGAIRKFARLTAGGSGIRKVGRSRKIVGSFSRKGAVKKVGRSGLKPSHHLSGTESTALLAERCCQTPNARRLWHGRMPELRRRLTGRLGAAISRLGSSELEATSMLRMPTLEQTREEARMLSSRGLIVYVYRISDGSYLLDQLPPRLVKLEFLEKVSPSGASPR